MIYIVLGNEEFLIKEKSKSLVLDIDIKSEINVDI